MADHTFLSDAYKLERSPLNLDHVISKIAKNRKFLPKGNLLPRTFTQSTCLLILNVRSYWQPHLPFKISPFYLLKTYDNPRNKNML